MLMTNLQLIEEWKAEEKEPFAGWDFSYLNGRMIEDDPPWSYTTRAMELMQNAASVLDIGTGGGERVLMMREAWPEKVVVTEAHPPNVKLATDRLGPLGVTVVDTDMREDRPFPFEDESFDLVLDRHSALNIGEITRVLTPGGTLLTQQVHGMWAADLLAEFGSTPQWPDATPEKYLPWIDEVGLDLIDMQDWQGDLAFVDVGALVYYLKAVPWLVPDFSVETHLDTLLRLQGQLDGGAALVYAAKKYIIEARKG